MRFRLLFGLAFVPSLAACSSGKTPTQTAELVEGMVRAAASTKSLCPSIHLNGESDHDQNCSDR